MDSAGFDIRRYRWRLRSVVQQVSEKRLPIAHEGGHEREVLDSLICDLPGRQCVEADDLGIGKRRQHGGVRRDDELRLLPAHLMNHVEKGELSTEGEWRVRLVEEIESARHEPLLEDGQE